MCCEMKKLLWLVVFVSLVFIVGCSKQEQEPSPAVHQKIQHTLTYMAGENGSLKGVSTQTVEHGGNGSTVTAVPFEYHHFVAWSDGVTSASRTDRNVLDNIKVTARFAIDQYLLTYSAEDHGTIDGATSQQVDRGAAGSPVTAVPASGYHFVKWSDDSTANPRTDANITAAFEVTASFALNHYTLTYTAGADGTIKGISPQAVEHGGNGSPVTAAPGKNYHFAGWSDGVRSASRTDRKVTQDIAVTARFAIDQHTLSYTAAEHGSIAGAKSQKVDHGGAGKPVKATPEVGYHFVGWSDGVKSASRTDSKVTADLAATADFALNQYTLRYSAKEHGSIEGATTQTVNHGGVASEVTANPDKGYHFAGWSDGLTTPARSDAKVTSNLTVSANFAINTYSTGGTVTGLVEGTKLVLQNNAGDDLAITAEGDFKFATELVNASSYEVSVLTQPTSPNQTCTVTAGSGIITAENVTDVNVACVLTTYTVGGTLSGLPEGDQVVLQNNKGNNLFLKTNGSFVFSKALDDGSDYEVEVHRQPKKPNWTCAVANGSATLAGQNVTDVGVDCYPEVVPQVTAGIRKVTLDWNRADFPKGVVFNLCRAQEDIANGGFSSCQELKGGALTAKVSNPLVISALTNDTPYWFQLEAHYPGGRQTLSKIVKTIPFGGLSDSGIDWCANDISNRFSGGTKSEKSRSCKALAATHPGQDAFYGRDASARARKLKKTGYGSAGFDFTKLCRSGEMAGEGKCPPNPLPGGGRNNWACTRDNVTGLTWEVKTDSGLQGKANTYTWYNPTKAVNGGKPGVKNGGSCTGSTCDTAAYVKAVNELGLCSASDWRLPTKRELLSVVDNGHFKPAADVRFFPNALSSYYWSSSPYPDQGDSAWQVYFLYGEASSNNKSQKNHIRLVRGRTVTFGLDNPQ